MEEEQLNQIKRLLQLSFDSEYCIIDDQGQYWPIEDGATGTIKKIANCIGEELFNKWPLQGDDSALFKRLISLENNC